MLQKPFLSSQYQDLMVIIWLRDHLNLLGMKDLLSLNHQTPLNLQKNQLINPLDYLFKTSTKLVGSEQSLQVEQNLVLSNQECLLTLHLGISKQNVSLSRPIMSHLQKAFQEILLVSMSRVFLRRISTEVKLLPMLRKIQQRKWYHFIHKS